MYQVSLYDNCCEFSVGVAFFRSLLLTWKMFAKFYKLTKDFDLYCKLPNDICGFYNVGMQCYGLCVREHVCAYCTQRSNNGNYQHPMKQCPLLKDRKRKRKLEKSEIVEEQSNPPKKQKMCINKPMRENKSTLNSMHKLEHQTSSINKYELQIKQLYTKNKELKNEIKEKNKFK